MATIERLRIYPLKGLDATDLERAAVTDRGLLAGDREFALCDPGAVPVEDQAGILRDALNGKQSDRLHELRTSFDPETRELAVTVRTGGETRRFDLDAPAGRTAAGEWFTDYLDRPLTLQRRPGTFVDRPDLGPSVVSTATLEAVASWFEAEGMTVDGARRRLRANVEVGGVPAFWEDRFLGPDAPAFAAGGVRFEGAEACTRCVVPQRDPDTGEPIPGFRRRFVERREATLPDWVDPGDLGSSYSVMLITRVPESGRGESLAVGDEVRVVD
ncbi:MAG: MOSC domain-containing protein [Salinirussus sp.]